MGQGKDNGENHFFFFAYQGSFLNVPTEKNGQYREQMANLHNSKINGETGHNTAQEAVLQLSSTLEVSSALCN